MKLLLQILWGWSVLANGAVGIQVGTVQTNNQNIKLMKTNFTSPVWLQSASNVGGEKTESLRFVTVYKNPQIKLSCIGDLTISSTYDGKPVTKLVSDLSDASVSVDADANSEIVIRGIVTTFTANTPSPGATLLPSYINTSKATSLTRLDIREGQYLSGLDLRNNINLDYLYFRGADVSALDISNNVNLTTLSFSSTQIEDINTDNNIQLTTLFVGGNKLRSLKTSHLKKLTQIGCADNLITSIDITENTLLTTCSCSNTTLLEIKCFATNSNVATQIAEAITNATSVDGTVTLRQGDEFNQTIIDAAMDKGWDVQYAE